MAPSSTSHRVYLSLGSNQGDRAAYLQEAIRRLVENPRLRITTVSRVIETPPWGNIDQPPFLNQVVALDTTFTPEELLHVAQEIEQAAGRRRTIHWGPRTLDIDLLLYDTETRDTEELTLPHPYLTQRRFVLEPLAEIAPDVTVRGKTVREWLAECPTA